MLSLCECWKGIQIGSANLQLDVSESQLHGTLIRQQLWFLSKVGVVDNSKVEKVKLK